MEQTKKMNGAELSNEVMRAAGKPWHDVPADWPEILRTDKAIKFAFALEAAGYLNEDWQPGPKLRRPKIIKAKTEYVANRFNDLISLNPVYALAEYWKMSILDFTGNDYTEDTTFKSEIKAIIENLREEEKAEKMARDYIPESRNDDEEETPRYIGVIPKTKMPPYLQRDLRKHLVSAIYSHLLTEKYNSFINSLDCVQSNIDNEFNAASLEDIIFDHVEETFEKILSEVATDIAALLCRVSQPIK